MVNVGERGDDFPRRARERKSGWGEARERGPLWHEIRNLLKGDKKMIQISKRAVEKLKETHQGSQKNLFRLFISGIG